MAIRGGPRYRAVPRIQLGYKGSGDQQPSAVTIVRDVIPTHRKRVWCTARANRLQPYQQFEVIHGHAPGPMPAKPRLIFRFQYEYGHKTQSGPLDPEQSHKGLPH
jgi:hypothetical protein